MRTNAAEINSEHDRPQALVGAFAEGLQNVVSLAGWFSRGQLNSLTCSVYKVLTTVPSIISVQ